MLHTNKVDESRNGAVSVLRRSDLAACPSATLPWSPPPHPGDSRQWAAVAGWRSLAAPSRMSQDASRLEAAICANVRLGSKSAMAATGLDFLRMLAALKDLVARGAVRDASEGFEARSEAWRDTCLEVLEAAPKAEGRKAKHLVGFLPHLKHGTVKAAIEALEARGLLAVASEVVVVRHVGAAVPQAEQPAASKPKPEKASKATKATRTAKAAKPAETVKSAKVAKARKSVEASVPAGKSPEPVIAPTPRKKVLRGSPVSFWVRRRHRTLAECLGTAAVAYPLPETESEARSTIAAMEAAVVAENPDALSRATSRQRKLVEKMLVELKGTAGVVSPFVGEELGKDEANAFITRWFSHRPGSDKQVACAQSICARLGIPMPSALTSVELGKFIGAHLAEAKAAGGSAITRAA